MYFVNTYQIQDEDVVQKLTKNALAGIKCQNATITRLIFKTHSIMSVGNIPTSQLVVPFLFEFKHAQW